MKPKFISLFGRRAVFVWNLQRNQRFRHFKKNIRRDDSKPSERDKTKGRILVAKKDMDVGEILFYENPLVVGSWHAHRCIQCHKVHSSSLCSQVQANFPADVAKNLKKIESALAKMSAIEELDRARSLISALNLCRQDRTVLDQILQCSTENMDACRKCITRILQSDVTRPIIPKGVTAEQAAAVLSALNTNSHELGEWGGSGLFPLACVMEHSCVPNCNFTANGKQL